MPGTTCSKWLQPAHHRAQLSPLAMMVVPEGKCVRKDTMLPISKKQRGKKPTQTPMNTKNRKERGGIPGARVEILQHPQRRP